MRPQFAFGLGQGAIRLRGWFCCLALIALGAIAGCGGTPGADREAVSGTVTREGIPIDTGTITFRPTGGGTAASTSITDGKYQFDKLNGPVTGTQKVEIVQFARRGEGPPGTPKKELPILPETRFKGTMPPNGWLKDAEVVSGHDSPLDFKIE